MKLSWRGWRWSAIVTLAIAGGLAVLATARGQGIPVRLARVARSSLVVPVLCGGTVQPPPGGELRAPEGALVMAILVKEGQRVGKGAPLVKLDAPELVARGMAARAELQVLRETRAVAEAQLQAGNREVTHRRQVLEADGRLLERAAISHSAYEADELALHQAEERLHEAEARLASIGDAGSSASRLGLATDRARDLQARLEALTVRAPAAGVVYGLPHRAGEAVTPGQVVANVTDPERPHVMLRVDAPDVPRVAADQRFFVTFDGLPDREWQGRIESVAPGLLEVSGREIGEALGVIDGGGRALPFGAAVSARIVVGERPAALVLPRAALHRDGARRFVYLARAGRAEPRDISVGLIGLNEVEVTGGLAEGESVVLPGDVPLTPGLRIRAGPERP